MSALGVLIMWFWGLRESTASSDEKSSLKLYELFNICIRIHGINCRFFILYLFFSVNS